MEAVKNGVVGIMNWAVRRYLTRNKVQVIAVAGSIGKTSTTNAIRVVLGQKYKVHVPKTTYNTNRSVHLELFDLPFASSMLGWMKMVATVLLRSWGKAPYEVVVIEIGTDHPGELRTFAWLKPEIGVLTAIAPEHMEYFKTIEAVAEEELSLTKFCDRLVFNAHQVDRVLVEKYAEPDLVAKVLWYGTGQTFAANNYKLQNNHVSADFVTDGQRLQAVPLRVLGEHSLDALTAAAAVASQLGLNGDEIAAGLRAVEPVKGRMQRLRGQDGAIIIDDTYNASPQACRAALDVLSHFEAPQHIAVLGMMNEMGEYSQQAHEEVGAYCQPGKLDMVVTIGADANKYLAAQAEKAGCKVARFDSPYEAGEFVKSQLKPGTAILFKGSQNGVFAEEAIKSVLADQSDTAKLTRQSAYWMERKTSQFKPH